MMIHQRKKHKKSNKVMKPSDFSKNKIQEYLRTGQIATFTVPQLKQMLETLGLKLSGKKDELINRIEKHFE